jgi:hypothetical protein
VTPITVVAVCGDQTWAATRSCQRAAAPCDAARQPRTTRQSAKATNGTTSHADAASTGDVCASLRGAAAANTGPTVTQPR